MSTLPKLHIVVLMGGWANEREVSLMSGNGVADALESRGHRVTLIDMGRDVAARIAEAKPDIVFNALHGVPGEDGTVQGMLDLMGVPYTHSGLATSVIAIDKELTKLILKPHGIPMPGGRVVRSEELYAADPLARPYVLKPVNEGSSVGVAIVTAESNCGNPIRRDAEGPWQTFDELVAEPYIRGHELTTAVIGGKAERLKILRSTLVDGQGEPGAMIDNRLTVACGSGAVRVVELQRAGGRPVSAGEFLRGASIRVGEVLS